MRTCTGPIRRRATLLGLIIEAVHALPVLLVLTARPEFESPWRSFNHVTTLVLNRLSPQLTRSLVDEVMMRYALPVSVVEQIVEKTDGVPLFVEELTRSVLDASAGADSGSLSMAIPSTLQDSLMARLDRVPLARELAQTAAAIGREVPLALITAVSSLSVEQLSDAIDSLVATGLWLERGTGAEKIYTFKHGLVQGHCLRIDVAFAARAGSWPAGAGARKRVRRYHPGAAGAAGPPLCRGRSDRRRHPVACNGRRAARWSVPQTGKRFAHYSRALTLIRELPESTERDRQELEFQIGLCTPLMLIHGFASPETVEAYDRALALCEKLGETEQLFPVLFGQWVQNTVYSTHDAAIDSATRLGELGRQYQDDFAVLRSQVCLGWSHTFMGNIIQARTHTADALARYQTGPPQRVPVSLRSRCPG